MSQSLEFLRAFFQDNNLFVNPEQKEETTEPKKDEKTHHTQIIHAPENSKEYASQKEINLKKMFWALEIEEKQFIKAYKKEQRSIEKQIKKSHAMPWIQQELRNTYLHFISSIVPTSHEQEIEKTMPIENQPATDAVIKAKRGRPKKNKPSVVLESLDLPIKKDSSDEIADSSIEAIEDPIFRISRGKQEYRDAPVEQKFIARTIEKKKEPLEKQAISENVKESKASITPISTISSLPIYSEGQRISRGYTKEYIPEQWARSPKRVSKDTSLFFTKLDASADQIQKIVLENIKTLTAFSTYFSKKIYVSAELYTKKSQEKVYEHIKYFIEKSKNNWNLYQEKRKLEKKLNFKKKQQLLQKKAEEKLLFEKEERRKIEALVIEKEKAKKQAAIIKEQQAKEWQDLQNKILFNIQQFPNALEKKLAIPKFSKVKNKWDSKTSQIKEVLQIGVMVASVFAVGTIGLSLPGWLHQYEYVWNADAFLDRQSSLDALVNNEANLSLQKLQNLPVAGDTQENTTPQEIISITPPDTRLIIPKIAQNIPIVFAGEEQRQKEQWDMLEKEIQKALQDGVVHYPGTAKPGENGNVFITGHSSYYAWDPGKYKDVFAPLHNLEVGDEYYIYHNGKKVTYTITERKIVPPSDVSVLDQDYNKKESTLMTCTPIGTAKNRLILRAEEKSVE